MDIRTQYVIHHKLSYYQTPKFYEDTSGNKIKLQRKNQKVKRLTVFDQIINSHAKIPGPGKYVINPQNIKRKKTDDLEIIKKKAKARQTYLDPIIKRSSSLPSVGKYDIQKYDKANNQIKPQKDKRQLIPVFRLTIFDGVNRDTLDTSPSLYLIRQSLQKSPRITTIAPQHKKEKSLPKIPSPQDYNPIPSSYNTFRSRSMSSLELGIRKSNFGERIQAKIQQKSPGPKYNLITNWVPNKKSLINNEFNIYKSVTGPSKPKDLVMQTTI